MRDPWNVRDQLTLAMKYENGFSSNADVIAHETAPFPSLGASKPKNADQRPVASSPAGADDNQSNSTTDAYWLPTHLMLIRREVVNAVGGFDETYGDSQIASADFCLKARVRKFKCLYTGAAVVVSESQNHADDSSACVNRYNDKWCDYAHLFSESKPVE